MAFIEIVDSGTKLTPLKTITDRIEAGRQYMASYVAKAQRNANRYLDSSARSLNLANSLGDESEQRDLPIGEVNYMAMNIRQKVAAISINAPDFQIAHMNEEEKYNLLTRPYAKEVWRKKRWGRLFRRVLTQMFVEGQGFLRYYWDRMTGFELDWVKAENLIIDPHTTDLTWNNLRWGAIDVLVPKEIAEKRYGKAKLEQAEGGDPPFSSQAFSGVSSKKKEDSYKITLYWDGTTEAEIYGKKELSRVDNLYGEVPLKTLLGQINPGGDFGLSDYDTALGTFEMLRRSQNIINNHAANGGGIPWMRSEYIDEKQRQKVINGTHQGYVLLNSVPGEQVLGYTANQPLNPAVLDAMKMLMQGLDADMGVNEYDRGVIQSNPKFATQATLLANRAGARGNLARIEFEQFVEEIIETLFKLSGTWGLNTEPGEQPDDETIVLFEACRDVIDVRVIEESMSFKDPALMQTQSVQVLREASAIAPMLQQTAGVLPNFKMLFDNVLRAYDIRDVDSYYVQAPMMAMPQEGQEKQEGENKDGETGSDEDGGGGEFS